MRQALPFFGEILQYISTCDVCPCLEFITWANKTMIKLICLPSKVHDTCVSLLIWDGKMAGENDKWCIWYEMNEWVAWSMLFFAVASHVINGKFPTRMFPVSTQYYYHKLFNDQMKMRQKQKCHIKGLVYQWGKSAPMNQKLRQKTTNDVDIGWLPATSENSLYENFPATSEDWTIINRIGFIR